MKMSAWRVFYWTRFLLVLFAVFIVATAALDVRLAPDEVGPQTAAAVSGARAEVPDVDVVVYEGGTDKVGGWLSRKVDDGLRGLDDIRLGVRDVSSSLGDLVGL